MSTQYYCKNKGRRNAIRSTLGTDGKPKLNGIDYLEVLDSDAPPGTPRQKTLLVRCFKSVAGLTRDNIRIIGGVRKDPRINPVRVEWAYPASWQKTPFTEDEKNFFNNLPEPDNVLVVRTDKYGDFSTYLLSIMRSATEDRTHPEFDPQLFQVDFSFKVECPPEFDCKQVKICSPERLSEPLIDYLSRDYSSFRRLMLDRLAVVMPDWKEKNPADVGIVLVELLAYAADHLSYFQDAVATEAYLGTARNRISIRRHARLLDYIVHDGCNARTWVCLEVDADADDRILRKEDKKTISRTRFVTRCVEKVVLDKLELAEILPVYRPEVFEPMHDLTLYRAHNTISFYTWSDDQCCLPRGATSATLKDNAGDRLRLCRGDVLILEERLGSATGKEADADITHRHAVRLTYVDPEATSSGDGVHVRLPRKVLHDPLTGQAIVEIRWAEEDALPFPLCISALENDKKVEDISVARGNVVLVDHGMVEDEELELETLKEGEHYRPRLQRSGITHSVPYDDNSAREKPESNPASAAATQKPLDALPAVELYENDETWTARRDLLSSDRFVRDFVVEMDDDGMGHLRFGDDVLGKKPVNRLRVLYQTGNDPAGAPAEKSVKETVLKATYRTGNGSRGNVGANAIAHVVPADSRINIRKVWNPLPARGGTDPEPTEQVRLYAPWAFRNQNRAVTEADYAEAAQRHSDVQKAVATLTWTGSWYTMFIRVDRKEGRPVDEKFQKDLSSFMERFRLAGYDLEIDGPIFVPLYIKMMVCVKPGYFSSDVKSALLKTFSNWYLEDGQRGFFHPDNFTFGTPVYKSKVVAEAMKVPGVLWVDITEFRRWGQPQREELKDGMISVGRLEIPRLDNDPSEPEYGKIELDMKGGL